MRGPSAPPAVGLQTDDRTTIITDFLNGVWDVISAILAPDGPPGTDLGSEGIVADLVPPALEGETRVRTGRDGTGATVFSVAAPVRQADRIVGVLGVTSAAGEIDTLVRNEREQVLQMFVIATLVSIGLSLVLASTIANPLSDLAAAAEIGRERNSRKVAPGRVRIPDLTARPDEIGRLSGALRGMVRRSTTGSTRTSSSRPMSRTRSRTRSLPCGQRSARSASSRSPTSATSFST